jgi:hypothetical protein
MENIRIRNAGLARIPRYWYRVTSSVQDPDPFWFWREDPESGSRRTLNLQDPEPNENDTLDPNPHQTKMSDHDPLPSWSESVTLQNRTHSCPFKIFNLIKKQCCGSGSARSTSFWIRYRCQQKKVVSYWELRVETSNADPESGYSDANPESRYGDADADCGIRIRWCGSGSGILIRWCGCEIRIRLCGSRILIRWCGSGIRIRGCGSESGYGDADPNPDTVMRIRIRLAPAHFNNQDRHQSKTKNRIRIKVKSKIRICIKEMWICYGI